MSAGGDGDGRAAHYATRAVAVDQTSPPVVRDLVDGWLGARPAPALLLDVGAGRGANLAAARRAGRPAVGAEVSLAAARAAVTDGHLLVVADGARLPFRDGAFAGALCTEVLEHVDDPAAVLAEIARVLRPGGEALVTTPNYANLAGVHKWLVDRRLGRREWNPWGAHVGGYEGFMTGRRLRAAARDHLDVVSARALDYGQALTGRFRVLDRGAHSRPGRAVLRRLLPLLHRPDVPIVAWHGMHIALVLRRPPRRP